METKKYYMGLLGITWEPQKYYMGGGMLIIRTSLGFFTAFRKVGKGLAPSVSLHKKGAVNLLQLCFFRG